MPNLNYEIMGILREIIGLGRMLFSSHPSEFDDLCITETKHFPFRGFIMMWCGRIVVRKEDESRLTRLIGLMPSWKNHERIHLNQAKTERYKDSWVRYYIIYLIEWFKGWPLFNWHNGAYYTIPQEIEAYANENNLSYKVLEDLKNSKYNLKHRIKIYKKNRKTLGWKTFIRTL